MPGINWRDRPFHAHDCDRCKFLFAIEEVDLGGKADFYESCVGDRPGHDPYVIRYGPEEQYVTTNLKSLTWHLLAHCGFEGWKERR